MSLVGRYERPLLLATLRLALKEKPFLIDCVCGSGPIDERLRGIGVRGGRGALLESVAEGVVARRLKVRGLKAEQHAGRGIDKIIRVLYCDWSTNVLTWRGGRTDNVAGGCL